MYTSDADLLAIRHPYVYEEIGGQQNDWDNNNNTQRHLRENIPEQLRSDNFQTLFDLKIPVGLIVEVKGGGTCPTPRIQEPQLLRAIQRIGFFSQRSSVRIACQLMPEQQFREAPPEPRGNRKAVVGTLLICQEQFVEVMRNERQYTHIISLEHCELFIQARFARYRDPKNRDRYFFSDELIQYLAWKAGVNVAVQTEEGQ